MLSRIIDIMIIVWLCGSGLVIGLVAIPFIGKWAAVVLGAWALSIIVGLVIACSHSK